MKSSEPQPAIGIIGLGNMGLPMAVRLLEAGYLVAGFDRHPDAQQVFAARGGLVVSNLSEAARNDIVILMLPDTATVRSVLSDPDLLSSLSPNTVVIDMSSSEPLATRELEQNLEEHGVQLIDAPVSGGVTGAENGTLTIMVGGSEESFRRVRKVLSHLGGAHHVGPVGAGHALKALNNLLSATHLWITCEAMIAGTRFGLDPASMLNVFNSSSGRSGSTENKWPNFILPGTYDSGFGLKLMLKDMKIATKLADQLGCSMVLGSEAVELWNQAAIALPDEADHTEVARWLSS